MKDFHYDLFVIGAGSGGARAARMAAQAGLKVAIAEDTYLGGTCVNVGCVPKKLFSYAAGIHESLQEAAAYGWKTGVVKFDWSKLLAAKNAAIRGLNQSQERMLKESGVTLYWARARFIDPHQIDLDGQIITAETILIATGGWPHVPDIPGRNHVITSNEAFFLEALPKQAVIVGGGYIAVEFATIFKKLGVEVTLLYRGDLFLRGFDGDIRNHMAAEMRQSGIDLRFCSRITAIKKKAKGVQVVLKDEERIKTDLVLYATGRSPNTKSLNVEAAGVRLNEAGAIRIDAYFRTSQPNIFALGDVTGHIQLTPVAIAEAMAFVRTLTTGKPEALDYDFIPTAVFSHPNIGTVGLSEEDARRQGNRIDVYLSRFRPLRSLVSRNPGQALVKLIVDQKSDRVLGLHIVAQEAAEITQGFAVAMKTGATKAQFDATIGIHPTLAEECVTLRKKRD